MQGKLILFHVYSSIINGLSLTSPRHYVAFIQKPLPDSSETTWVLYNDEKVVQAENVKEMKQFAYIYFFRKVSA